MGACAIGGIPNSRHNVGSIEARAGNFDRALKHYMIATGSGCNVSLKKIEQLYSDGCATKKEYTEASQAYQNYLHKVKSRQRDEAAAFDDDQYRYL